MPSPTVVTVIKPNPNKIVFLLPSLFFIWPLKGAKIICAIEKMAKIKEMSPSFSGLRPSLKSQSTDEMKLGRTAMTLLIIMLPIVSEIRQAIRI